MEELGDVARASGAPPDTAHCSRPPSARVELREHELVGDLSLELEPGGHRLAPLLVTADLAADRHRPVEDLPLRSATRPRAVASTPAYTFSNTRGTLQMKCGRVSGRLSRSLSRFSAKAVVRPWATPRNDSSRANEWASGRNSRCTQPSSHRRRLRGRGQRRRCGCRASARRPWAARWCRRCRRSTPRRRASCSATRSASVDLWASALSRPDAPQRLPRHHRLGRLRRLVAAHDDDVLELRQLLARLQHLGQLRGVLDEHGARPRVVDHVGDQVGRIARVDRHGDAAGAEDREVGLHPLGAARRQQRHRVALAAGRARSGPAPARARCRPPRATCSVCQAPPCLNCWAGRSAAPLDSAPEHPGERVLGHARPPATASAFMNPNPCESQRFRDTITGAMTRREKSLAAANASR